MDRGTIGTMPAAATLDDESYLDFTEGLRLFTLTKVNGAMAARAQPALEEYEGRAGQPVEGLAGVQRVLDPIPIVRTRNFLMRHVQEMMWDRARETYDRRRPELERALDEWEPKGVGSLHLNPQLKLPDYYEPVDFHIQPDGYHHDQLAGYVYHYGTKVFYTGLNDHDEVNTAFVNLVPPPSNSRVERVLDVACSLGQSTTALKQRFPTADVWGIDLSAPFLRYAHMRAARMGLEVHFAQRDAADLQFEDDSFDLVYAYILYHEVPIDVGRRIIDEIHRVLRPGGVYGMVDFANRPPEEDPLPPVGEYMRAFDTVFNGEPYAYDFVRSRFNDYLAHKFRSANPDAVPIDLLPGVTLRVCIK